MKILFVTVLLATTLGSLASPGIAKAADGCGVGCHATVSGACVVDGWGTAHVRNECPAGARPRPPCPGGWYYVWRKRYQACFQS
jgi:hypothetical protein